MNADPGADPARARFIIIQALRWSGVALVLLGLLVVNHRIDLPMIAGYVMLAVGLIDAFAMPIVLAKLWKSPVP